MAEIDRIVVIDIDNRTSGVGTGHSDREHIPTEQFPNPDPEPIVKDIVLPSNGTDKREGGLFDFNYLSQVERISQPYIPGKCIFEFPSQQQSQNVIWGITDKRATRPGTRIMPISSIETFTQDSPVLVSGALFDYTEVTANGIRRFRYIGDHPIYVHLKGSLRVQKKMANQATTAWNLSNATLRLNPVGMSAVPQEAKNNVGGAQYLAYTGPTLAPTGTQPQYPLGGGLEYRDLFYRWREFDEQTYRKGDEWDQSRITYLEGTYIENGAIQGEDDDDDEEGQVGTPGINTGLDGALTARFDVSDIQAGRFVRVYVDNPDIEDIGISTRFRVLFRDAAGETMARDWRQYASSTSHARVIRIPEGAKECYLYFKRPADTASRVRIANVADNVSQITLDPAYGVWGEYVFEVDRPVTLYPGVIYDFNIYMGSGTGLTSGVFENDVLRMMGGSLSFDFNAYPYLKKKGILK